MVSSAPSLRQPLGPEWLSDCANGPLSTSEGVGGPSEWLPAGSLQHMTYVVRSLPGG
jgi:hypothetical protein